MADETSFLDGHVAPVTQPAHRPSQYTEATGDRICELIAKGMTMDEVAETPGFPGRSTIFKWVRLHPEFALTYQCAMRARVERDADQLMKLATDSSRDRKLIEGEGPDRYEENKTSLGRSTLAVETLKWLMEKRMPRVYGPAELQLRPEPEQLPGNGDQARLVHGTVVELHPLRDQLKAWSGATKPPALPSPE